MLSLGVMKDGVILPSEEDRKRILTQMKVRTTLKGDNSWIQQKSECEEESNHSPIHSPLRTRENTGRSPASPTTLSPNRRITFAEPSSQVEAKSPTAEKSPSKTSPSASSPSGYLIRGVFTKTIDKSAPSNPASNGSPKSAKTASLPRFAQGYKMTTEDYKRLAPYNIKRELSDPGDVEPSVSSDEQKKRTEAASSVLRRTASRERSYVLSAAKKSNGSSIQEAPPFMAKRVDVEDDTGPRSRSQTMPASAWFSSRGKSSTNGERRGPSGSPWSESRMASAASSTRSKPDQEKHELASWDNSALKVPVSPKRSEKTESNSQSALGAETRRTNFSEDSWETRKPRGPTLSEITQVPHIVISPDSSPKRSSSHYRSRDAAPAAETYHRTKIGESLRDVDVGLSRFAPDHEEGISSGENKYGSPSSRVAEFHEHEPVTAKPRSFTRDNTDAPSGTSYNVPTHFGNEEDLDYKRFLSDFEKKTTQEMAYESPSDTEYKKVEAHMAKSGSWSSESSLSTTGTQSELLRAAKRDESEFDTARSSSLSAESGVATPESQLREHGSDSDTGRSYYPFRDGPAMGSPRSHRVPFYQDICETETRRTLTGSGDRASPDSFQFKNTSGYDSDPTTSSKGLLFVKESIKSTELSSSPRYNSRSLADLSELDKSTYSSASYLNSAPPKRLSEDICTYCGREIRNCPKITIEQLKICCHEYCFRCGICHKPMGDLLEKIFIHRDIVHCDKCYEKLF
ncbi:zinc finger protein 185 [Elgaria multicarinata webbii]|uniref:zinc finger protein 185 n=1 Tax=Elgaria multicarinata webbii TaxID=159646 RepID=UPI002FCCC7BC